MKITIDLPYVVEPHGSINHQVLLNMVIEAHANSARNNPNASSAACLNASSTTGRLENALASAILTLGVYHAPISEARLMLITSTRDIVDILNRKIPIAGFGNSFYKDGIDPAWQDVANYIEAYHPWYHFRIQEIKSIIGQQTQKNIYPNAAMYSAVLCEILGFKEGTEISLFILARIPTWTDMVVNQKT